VSRGSVVGPAAWQGKELLCLRMKIDDDRR
jgi:hypothetical protein